MSTQAQNSRETNEPLVRRVKVLNPPGLHARPASVLAAHAKGFKSEVTLILISSPSARSEDIGMRVDAKNILDVIVLGAPEGAEIDIEASGPDAVQAVEAIAQLFSECFGMRD